MFLTNTVHAISSETRKTVTSEPPDHVHTLRAGRITGIWGLSAFINITAIVSIPWVSIPACTGVVARLVGTISYSSAVIKRRIRTLVYIYKNYAITRSAKWEHLHVIGSFFSTIAGTCHFKRNILLDMMLWAIQYTTHEVWRWTG